MNPSTLGNQNKKKKTAKKYREKHKKVKRMMSNIRVYKYLNYYLQFLSIV